MLAPDRNQRRLGVAALDHLLLALPHLSQIHFDETSLHTIIACPPGTIGDTRACRHGFSRRSTIIDAASPTYLSLTRAVLSPAFANTIERVFLPGRRQ